MLKDPTEFRLRFAAWKEGKLPYEAGLPKYADGKGEIVTDYPIPFVKDKVVKLTDAGLATGAVLSTNLLDSIADNAYRAGLDLLTALGLATKESTLGNPTDDRSMRTLLSALKQKELTDHLLEVSGLSYDLLFGLHINRGDIVRGQELINWYKDENNIEHKPSPPLYTTHPDRKSVIQKAFEFYKQYPDKYNPGQKNYQRLVDKRGAEVMGSPEVQKWLKERNIKKAVGNFNRVNPLLKESKFNLPAYKNGKPVLVNGNPTNALFNSDGTFTDDITKVFDDFYVTPSGVTTKYGSHTDKNWDRYKQLESFYKYRDLLTGRLKGEPGLEIVSPEFEILSLGGGIKQMYDTYRHIPGLKIKPLNLSSSSWIYMPKRQPYNRYPYSVSWDDFIREPEVGKYFDEGGEALVHEAKNNPGFLVKLKSELGEGKTLEDLEFMVNRDLHINDLPGTEPIIYKGFSVSSNPQRILDRVSGKPKTILNERFYPIYEQRKLTPYHKVNTDAFKVDQEMLVNDWAAKHGYEYLPNGWLKYGNISVSDQGFNNFAFDEFGNMKFIDPMIQTF